jgi:hypothetical protein
MDFSKALYRLKEGKALARKNWNARGQFVYLVPAAEYPAQTGVAKDHFGQDAKVPYTAYFAIKTVQGTVAPWLASQTDLMAEDWQEVDPTDEP